MINESIRELSQRYEEAFVHRIRTQLEDLEQDRRDLER